MSVKEISELVSEINEIANNIKSVQLTFINRNKKKGEYGYSTFSPILGKNLNNEILNLIIRPFADNISALSLEQYDPLMKNNDTIEYINKKDVVESEKVLNQVNALHEAESFSLKDIDNRSLLGYCIKCVSVDNKEIYCFKKLTNTKLLEKKKLFWGVSLTNSTIEKITNQPLIIDERVDCVLYEDIFYIHNSYLFEILFSINEEYRRKINSILAKIGEKEIIVNIESFSVECKSIKTAQKRLIKIASSEFKAIDILKEEPEKMIGLIKEHNLDIDISLDNKIVYNEGDDVEPILRLLDGGLITMDVYGIKGHTLKFSRSLE